jgi:hypothetical protein
MESEGRVKLLDRNDEEDYFVLSLESETRCSWCFTSKYFRTYVFQNPKRTSDLGTQTGIAESALRR